MALPPSLDPRPATLAEAWQALDETAYRAREGAEFFHVIEELDTPTIRRLARVAHGRPELRPVIGNVIGRAGDRTWEVFREEYERTPGEAKADWCSVAWQTWPKPAEPPAWLVDHHLREPTWGTAAILATFGLAGKRAALRNGFTDVAEALFPMDDGEFDELGPIILRELRPDSPFAYLALRVVVVRDLPYDGRIAALITVGDFHNREDWNAGHWKVAFESLYGEVRTHVAGRIPELLRTDTTAIRKTAAVVARCIPPTLDLVRALRWKDEPDLDLRVTRIESIAVMGNDARSAFPFLWNELESNDRDVSNAALLALTRLGADPERVVPRAISLLATDTDLALWVLRKLGTAARAALSELDRLALRSRGDQLRWARTHEALSGVPATETLFRWYDELSGMLKFGPLRALTRLPEETWPDSIAEVKKRLRAQPAKPELVFALVAMADRSEETLTAARAVVEEVPRSLWVDGYETLIRALAETRTGPDILLMDKLLRSEEYRYTVLNALARDDEVPEELVRSIVACLESESLQERFAARVVLQRLRPVPPFVVHAIRRGITSDRLLTVQALTEMRDSEVLPWLRFLLRVGSLKEQEVAAIGLWKFGDKSGYRDLLRSVDPRVREMAVRRGYWADGADPIEWVLALVRDPVPRVRYAALSHLADLEPRPVAVEDALKRAANDPYTPIRMESKAWLTGQEPN